MRQRSPERVVTIDWRLLFRRLGRWAAQLFRSARHRAAQTDYQAPSWATNFRLGWFRLGLIALAIFVLTQKQIDFTVSVGKLGLSAGQQRSNEAFAASKNVKDNQSSQAATAASNQLSVLPSSAST
ncbi:MAG: hypothetical protein HC821_01860, partial [Lewinella sp.]|nr:hypothetical protein [Lewinella sp.]